MSNLVSFGPHIKIDTKRRLSRFDNGETLAYEAYDSRNKNKTFIALVCGDHSFPSYGLVTTYKSFAEQSLMHCIGSGVVQWPLENKQKFVILYAGGVGDTLLLQGQFNATPWRHPDIMSLLIQPIANIFREFEGKGFAHGAIRPWNIFHGSANKDKPIMLGDCLGAQPHSTQPSVFLTIERALASPHARGRATLQDDIYAFGVSLAFFLRKNDELSGLDDDAIVRKKIEQGSFSAIIGNERFQGTFLEILRGTLHDNPKRRWTVDDIFAWLDGTRLNPAPAIKRIKANRPILFMKKKYLYPEVLALDLCKSPSDAMVIIKDGTLKQWVEKSIDDAGLKARYEKASDRIGDGSGDTDFIAAQMRMALFPALPVFYNGKCFHFEGLGGLLAEAMVDGRDTGFFKKIMNLNLPDHAVSFQELAQVDMLENLKLFDKIRSFLQQNHTIGAGLERCLYTLSQNVPCLSPLLENKIVSDTQSFLLACEDRAKGANSSPVFLDQHSIAMFFVTRSRMVDSCMFGLGSQDKDQQIAGNLKFLGMCQKLDGNIKTPNLAKLFAKSASGVFKVFKNRALREKVQKQFEQAAEAGDLSTMAAILDDEQLLNKDNKAFKIASQEYKVLQEEYNEYNKRLGNKRTYGVKNGHDNAAIVSWLIATFINVVVILAFLSGYRMF